MKDKKMWTYLCKDDKDLITILNVFLAMVPVTVGAIGGLIVPWWIFIVVTIGIGLAFVAARILIYG